MITDETTCKTCGGLMIRDHEFIIKSIVENIDPDKNLQYGPLINNITNSVCDFIYVSVNGIIINQ